MNRTAAGLSPVRAGAAAAGNEEGKRVRAGRMVAARGNVGFVPAWIRNANVVLGARMSGDQVGLVVGVWYLRELKQ